MLLKLPIGSKNTTRSSICRILQTASEQLKKKGYSRGEHVSNISFNEHFLVNSITISEGEIDN